MWRSYATPPYLKCWLLRNSVSWYQIFSNECKFFIKFAKDSTSPERFELLCRDGRRVPVSEYRQCSWALVPSDAVVTSSARNSLERKKYQKFLKKIIEMYSDSLREDALQVSFTSGQNKQDNNYYNRSHNDAYDRFGPLSGYRGERLDSSFTTEQSYMHIDRNDNQSLLYEKFHIFESKRYGKTNLLFQVFIYDLPEEFLNFTFMTFMHFKTGCCKILSYYPRGRSIIQ